MVREGSARRPNAIVLAFTAITALVLAFAIAASAHAASVAYLDGNEVWVSTTDGARKTRLSGGEGDWRAVAQSDQGYIVGIQLESGKIAALSRFTIWDPSGNRIRFGPLAGTPGGWSEAYPLGLELTPDAGLIVYGFSRCTGALPCGTLIRGHYLLPSTTVAAPVLGPYANNSIRFPTLVGERVVGTPDDSTNAVQEAGSTASTNFVNWFNYAAGGYSMERTDVSANGSITATELELSGGRRIAIGKYSGLGGAYVDDCFLDADATATHPSVSQDGSEFAWQDGGGVKVAGVPNFNGASICQLTRAPAVISPTGSYPSIGPFNVPLSQSPPTGLPGPVVTAPAAQKIAGLLKGGMAVKISSQPGGRAKVTLTVKPRAVGRRGSKPVVIASASVDVPAGGATKSIKLKLNRTGKSLRRKLKGKRATLTVTIDGRASSRTIKLK
jgi:hypothetical protein